MILVQDLRKSFGELKAVDGVDFEIAEGETFGLLGPNGAGKSTAINMMVGALEPSSGSVSLAGNHQPSDPETRRRLGVAPQRLSLYEEFSGAENLRFFGRLYGLVGSELEERVAFGLSFAGLEDKGKARVKTYSGGMQRRLNLSCAILHRPAILLLDEPTAGVDPQSRNRLFENIEVLKEEGCTVVYTTHYMEEAERLCDRVAIIDHGKILDLDTVPALIERHGGTSKVRVELSSSPPQGAEPPGVLDGQTLVFNSAHPLQDLMRLRDEGWALASFQVDSPDLESVFLELTGRRLRD